MVLNKLTDEPNKGTIPKRRWICVPMFIKQASEVPMAYELGSANLQHKARALKCKIGKVDFLRNSDKSVTRYPVPGFSRNGIPTPGGEDPPPGWMLNELFDGSGRRAYTGPVVSEVQANGYIVFVQAPVFREG